jgi:hypothetical protein
MGNAFTKLDAILANDDDTLGSAQTDDSTAQTQAERSKHEALVCNVTGYVTKPFPDSKFRPSTSISDLKKASEIAIPAQHSTAPAAAPSLLGDSLPLSAAAALHGPGPAQNGSSISTFKFGNPNGGLNSEAELSIPTSQSTFQWSAGESTSIKRKASPAPNASLGPRKTSSS